ncbi:MAG: HU family DNA-binding protein [Bacteroidota bacterium]
MIKAEVISEIAKRTGISKSDVRLTVEAFLQTIKNTVAEKEEVRLRGFGSFVAKKSAKKMARNIAQNTALIINERYKPSFKPAKAFLHQVSANTSDSI